MSRPLLDRTAPSPLTDRFGRVHTDLRVSLTDRRNLRCTYCMPAEGLDWLPRPELLTEDEVVRLVRVAATRLGITEVRLTGGEPLRHRSDGGRLPEGGRREVTDGIRHEARKRHMTAAPLSGFGGSSACPSGGSAAAAFVGAC